MTISHTLTNISKQKYNTEHMVSEKLLRVSITISAAVERGCYKRIARRHTSLFFRPIPVRADASYLLIVSCAFESPEIVIMNHTNCWSEILYLYTYQMPGRPQIKTERAHLALRDGLNDRLIWRAYVTLRPRHCRRVHDCKHPRQTWDFLDSCDCNSNANA
jgi:hypothetical protein